MSVWGLINASKKHPTDNALDYLCKTKFEVFSVNVFKEPMSTEEVINRISLVFDIEKYSLRIYTRE